MHYPRLVVALLFLSLFALTQGELSLLPLLKDALSFPSHFNALIDERLPRLLVLLFSGAGLAIAGVLCQALFQNPLASPGVLGISSGGSFAVLLLFLSGWHLQFPLLLPLVALAGCFTTLLLLLALSKRALHHLILTGIALTTLFAALQGALIYCFRDDWSLLQLLTEWQAGSSFNRNWHHVHMLLPLSLVAGVIAWKSRKELNLLSLGEEEALNLGVDTQNLRKLLFVSVTLFVGGSLAALGVITFFGLILPHITRSFTGANHEKLLPTAAFAGAFLMVALDSALRFLNWHFLTIGNVSALLGGLFFFLLLLTKQRKEALCFG